MSHTALHREENIIWESGKETPPPSTHSHRETCTPEAVNHLLCAGGGYVQITCQKWFMQTEKREQTEITLGALNWGWCTLQRDMLCSFQRFTTTLRKPLQSIGFLSWYIQESKLTCTTKQPYCQRSQLHKSTYHKIKYLCEKPQTKATIIQLLGCILGPRTGHNAAK